MPTNREQYPGQHDDHARHLVSVRNELSRMREALPAGSDGRDRKLAAGMEYLETAEEAFRLKFYPRRYKVLTSLTAVVSVSKTGHARMIYDDTTPRR